MSYFEMKMMVSVLSRILLDNEIRGEHTKKRIFNLISKLNGMLTKQVRNAWYNIRYGFLVFYVGSNFNFNGMEYKMNKETKEGIAFLIVLGLGWSSIILLNWLIN